ncbi:MAG TPA: hypothetical protein VH370_18625 [Humisphaera sp.]|jgi:hypothetical protein|nr:hypothetical protein [Humisphaera sp.]
MLRLIAQGLVLSVLMLSFGACAHDKATAEAELAPPPDNWADLTWPRKHEIGGTTLLIYQPQVEKWEGNQLESQAAVALTPNGKTAPEYGVIWIKARTEVDKESRMVSLENVTITKVSFPSDRVNESLYREQINQVVPDITNDVPLDQLETSLAVAAADRKTEAVEVKNDVPLIIFDTKPSILILIDGEPALRATTQENAMRVVNTRQLILLDTSKNQYYLSLMGHWVTGPSALGPWTAAPDAPPGFDALKESLSKAGTVDLLIPNNPKGAPVGLPKIYISDTPAELIQSRGEPEYAPVEGTNLLYMKNSESAVFMQLGTGNYYVLVSGRWFSSPALHGPWAFVPGKMLPPDFANIPPGSPKANVLLSVPGTAQAREAVIANSIPQTATVTIAQTQLTVSYDGTPDFKPVADASGLQYAINSPLPVILVEESKTYYCVQNGIWFHASSPRGTWVVATTVPTVLYSIPISSPIHYVTYVRIYGSTPQVVYVGYTPGYMGTCVAYDGVVVYGSGYYYPAYVGTVWVGYPPTYGYGAGFACGAATGFAFGFAAGAIIGDCWPRPYWGPCMGYGSVNINTHSVYTNWHGGVTSVNRHYSYNAYTGTSLSQGRGSSFNPYTGRASVGGYSNYVDRSTGNFDLKQGGATYNPNTGMIKGSGTSASGNYHDGTADVNHGSFNYDTKTNTGVATKDGNVYASHDGNVYRTTDSGWQQHTDNGWQTPSHNDDSFSQQRQSLDAQQSSRSAGEQRFQGFRSSGSFFGGGGGGGFFGGGGGFRGRR